MTEKAEIQRLGGTPIKNSGRGQVKGDATWERFLVDIKEAQSSFTLNQRVWSKVCTDSTQHHLDPMLLVVLSGQTRLAVIELDVLKELLES